MLWHLLQELNWPFATLTALVSGSRPAHAKLLQPGTVKESHCKKRQKINKEAKQIENVQKKDKGKTRKQQNAGKEQ